MATTSVRREPAAPAETVRPTRGLRVLKVLTLALAAWSTMIWVQRIRNIVDNRAGESFVPPVLNLVLVAAAVAAVFLAPRAVKVLAALAFGLWSVGWWVANQAINLPKPVPPWVPAEQAVPFKVVHAVLGLVAIALGAALAWRAWQIRSTDRNAVPPERGTP